jgi:hypothetical protein
VDTVEHDSGPGPVEQSSDGADPGQPEVVDGAVDGEHPTTESGGADEGSEVRDPLRFNNWMKRSATGAVMTGIAVGLQQALQLPRQEPAFVIEASGEPHDPDHPIDLHFDPDNPADTVAIIRRPAPAEPPEEPPAPA